MLLWLKSRHHIGWIKFAFSAAAAVAFVMVFTGTGCGKKSSETQAQQGHCPPLKGSPWVPSVSGSGDAHHASDSIVTSEVYEKAGPLIGAGEPAPMDREIEFRVPMAEDLGPGGSVTLIAETVGFPSSLKGGAYPMLASLHDGAKEWIRLPRDGRSRSDCASMGYLSCDSGGKCEPNAGCQVDRSSAYLDHASWLSRQVNPSGYLSVNLFPTCDWKLDGAPGSNEPECPFNREFFVNGDRLRSGPGVEYVARYALLASSHQKLSSSQSAGIRLTVLKKRSLPSGGAIDLRIFLVGTRNVKGSRTPRGKANLDLLLSRVAEHYGQDGLGVRLGRITSIEWGCEQEGDSYATLSSGALSDMIESANRVFGLGREARTVNVFLVSHLSAGDESSTLLGVASSLGGPMVSGTSASGLVFSSFNRLSKYQENDPMFVDMASTISHEMGHFLGLSHVSERTGEKHDSLPDTPVCTLKGSARNGDAILTNASCSADMNLYRPTGKSCADVCIGYDGTESFCPDRPECEFNHVMWWTSKGYDSRSGQGDGNIFSPLSSRMLRLNPLIW